MLSLAQCRDKMRHMTEKSIRVLLLPRVNNAWLMFFLSETRTPQMPPKYPAHLYKNSAKKYQKYRSIEWDYHSHCQFPSKLLISQIGKIPQECCRNVNVAGFQQIFEVFDERIIFWKIIMNNIYFWWLFLSFY